MMADLRFLSIGERRYAVGLWWQIRAGGPATRKVLLPLARQVAIELREQGEHHNTVALRSRQFGLGQTSTLPSPCYSLAGAIKTSLGQDSFLGIFCLEESLWWVCAISKGSIAANGDSWHETRGEAEKSAHSQQQLIGGEFAIYTTPEESLALLEPLLKPDRQLEALFPGSGKRKGLIKATIIACALVALLFSGSAFLDFAQKQNALRAIRLAMNEKERHQKKLREHPEQFFPMLWQNEPLVADAGRACANAILAQPLVSLGWSLDELVCSPDGGLSVYRTHNTGASFAGLPAHTKLVTSQKTVQSVRLPAIRKRPFIDHRSLPERNKVSVALYEITQALEAKLDKLNWEAPEQIVKDEVALSSPWQMGNFSISGVPHASVADALVFRALEYPGLMILAVAYNAKDHNWTIQGVSYAQAE